MLSAILAIGLCSLFVWPLLNWSEPTTAADGAVMGKTISAPLQVEVELKLYNQTRIFTVAPAHGSLTEAIAAAANQAAISFSYQSRGSSIYLAEIADQSDNQYGHWAVMVNGLEQSDLSLAELQQGDRISLTYRSATL